MHTAGSPLAAPAASLDRSEARPLVAAQVFREALGQWATGVTVVTTRDAAGRPHGLTVSAFSSVSMAPPIVLVCIDNRSTSHAAFQETGVFGVNVLAEEQQDWSRRFATAGDAKFDGVQLDEGAAGALLVPGALAQLACRVVGQHPAGDHVVYLGEVLDARIQPGRPLLYHARDYRRLAL